MENYQVVRYYRFMKWRLRLDVKSTIFIVDRIYLKSFMLIIRNSFIWRGSIDCHSNWLVISKLCGLLFWLWCWTWGLLIGRYWQQDDLVDLRSRWWRWVNIIFNYWCDDVWIWCWCIFPSVMILWYFDIWDNGRIWVRVTWIFWNGDCGGWDWDEWLIRCDIWWWWGRVRWFIGVG